MSGVYEHVRVVELGESTALAYAGQILADRAADVVKVEPPEGDSLRHRRPHRPGESKTFQWLARGKRSLVLDASTATGRSVLQRLTRRADVLLTDWSIARLAGAGLELAELVAACPRLIVVYASAFGAGGRWAERPSNDVTLQAYSGLMASEGKRAADGAPDLIRCTELTQFPTGLSVAMGVAAALYHRERTQLGQVVTTSALATALLIQGGRVGRNAAEKGAIDSAASVLHAQRAAGLGYAHLAKPFKAPDDPVSRAGRIYYRAFATQDGAVFMGALSRALRNKIRAALGIDFLLRDDPDFDPEDPALLQRCEVFERDIVALFRGKTTAEWLAILEANGVPCGEVTFPEDLSDHEQARANRLVVGVEHPEDGAQLQVAPAARFACDPEPTLRPAPGLGEHTQTVLDELAVSR